MYSIIYSLITEIKSIGIILLKLLFSKPLMRIMQLFRGTVAICVAELLFCVALLRSLYNLK